MRVHAYLTLSKSNKRTALFFLFFLHSCGLSELWIWLLCFVFRAEFQEQRKFRVNLLIKASNRIFNAISVWRGKENFKFKTGLFRFKKFHLWDGNWMSTSNYYCHQNGGTDPVFFLPLIQSKPVYGFYEFYEFYQIIFSRNSSICGEWSIWI